MFICSGTYNPCRVDPSEFLEFSKKDQKISFCLKIIPLFHCYKQTNKHFHTDTENSDKDNNLNIKKIVLIFNTTVNEHILSMVETGDIFFLLTYVLIFL